MSTDLENNEVSPSLGGFSNSKKTKNGLGFPIAIGVLCIFFGGWIYFNFVRIKNGSI